MHSCTLYRDPTASSMDAWPSNTALCISFTLAMSEENRRKRRTKRRGNWTNTNSNLTQTKIKSHMCSMHLMSLLEHRCAYAFLFFFLLLPFSLYFYCCTEWMTIDELFVAYIIVFTCISFYCSLVSVSVLISFCCCISFRTKVLHVFLSQSFCCQLQKKYVRIRT